MSSVTLCHAYCVLKIKVYFNLLLLFFKEAMDKAITLYNSKNQVTVLLKPYSENGQRC
jgi:hypothetical protein